MKNPTQIRRTFGTRERVAESTTIASTLEFCKADGCQEFAITADPKAQSTLDYYCVACKVKAVARGESGERMKYTIKDKYVDIRELDKANRQRQISAIFSLKVRNRKQKGKTRKSWCMGENK